MKLLWNYRRELLLILGIFFLWRFSFAIPQILSPRYLPLQNSYIGGGSEAYLRNPSFWQWSNYDGERYVYLARYGYTNAEYFYFPLYFLFIRYFAPFFGYGLASYVSSGIVLSHVFFIVALVGLWKLMRFDYGFKSVLFTILLFFAFPTSFYFISIYTESLFLCVAILSFYFARKGEWVLAAFFAAVASGTRLVGISLFPALLIEYFLQKGSIRFSKKDILPLLYICISPFGFIGYVLYLFKVAHDPLAFFHGIEIFGQQRSTKLVILPQVFYRYIFKILPQIPLSYFAGTFTTYLEFGIALLFLILLIVVFLRMRLSL
jgi:Gpi18-like mannosyltransferase